MNLRSNQTTLGGSTPSQIGRYEILKVLGSGGTGIVYRVYDPNLEREVALKCITNLPDLTGSDEWMWRFRREVQAAGQLRHPHIVTVHDADLDHDPPYVVMELLTGGSLKDRLLQKPLSWREALVLLRPLVEALAYAHRVGLIHRDVKPANVMFVGDEADTLKLVDFGLARWQDAEQMTQVGVVMGTLAYMSPEQARGGTIDARTDIFAVGIILFEAIAGYNPLIRGSAVSTLKAPAEVVRLIERAVAKDRNRRYETCEALLADWDRCLEAGDNGRSPDVPEIEPPYGTMRPDSRFYIERATDGECWACLSKPYATTLFVQAPRQMGKSSLMRRMIDRAEKERGKRAVFIDFQEFPKQYFTDADDKNFLVGLCLRIGRASGVDEAISQYWQGPDTNLVKCSLYLSEYIIPQVNEPFILAMDEVDRMLISPFRTDFFGMLRMWHNRRAYEESFEKMSLFLSSATESFLLVDDPYQSPFNVAEVVSLRDFTRAEVEELNRRHRSLLNEGQIDDLMALVGGHPFLTRLAFYKLATSEMSLEALLSRATDDDGPFGDYLRRYLMRVLQSPELKQALAQICRTHAYEENEMFYRLKGAGLINRVGKQIVLRNDLYARYFKERLDD